MKRYFFILLAFLFIRCSSRNVYEEYKTLKNEEWCIHQTLRYHTVIRDSANYMLTLSVRHTTDYEMANLWCFLTIKDSTQILCRDTLNLKLAESDGRWLGKGFTLKNIEKTFPETFLLTSGSYTIEIEQGMRIKCLKGIKNVGITVSETQPH